MSQPPQSRPEPYDRALGAVELIVCSVFLFGPLFLIAFYSNGVTAGEVAGVGGASVGMAVILRATARRILGTAAGGILRASFAAFSRASSRTVMRRAVRFALRMLFAAIARDRPIGDQTADPQAANRRSAWLPVLTGAIGLSLSFAGVLALLPDPARIAIAGETTGTALAAVACAGLSLVVYALIVAAAARRFGVSLRFNTAFDGLLLQAYFTGGASFLPLTTDVEYEGPARQRMFVAAATLAGLLAVHFVLWALAGATGWKTAQVAAGMVMVFCFVYSFPISPLDGYQIWSASKRAWCAAWVPILLVFITHFPDVLSSVL
ncbi:MAG: hypothetical protein AB7Q97_05265 [Gammaproteobacteria bacterium]